MPSLYKQEEAWVIWLENHEHNANVVIYSTSDNRFYLDYSHLPVINGNVSHGDSVKYCNDIDKARGRIGIMANQLDSAELLQPQAPITNGR